jgi:cell division protein FtsB
MPGPRSSRGGRAGAAGRAPTARSAGASRVRRSRAGLPARTARPAVARRRRTTLTARAAVLAVAVASVALAVALPFKIWLAQRGQIADLRAQTQAQERHVAALQQQQQRWSDPAYIEQQARLRLHYVLPGEKAYVYLGPKPGAAKPATKDAAGPAGTGPWYSRLWQTVQVAGTEHATPGK